MIIIRIDGNIERTDAVTQCDRCSLCSDPVPIEEGRRTLEELRMLAVCDYWVTLVHPGTEPTQFCPDCWATYQKEDEP